MAVYKDRAFNGIGGNELRQIGKLFEIQRNKQMQNIDVDGDDEDITITIDWEPDNKYDSVGIKSIANININISIESDKDLDMIDKVYERLHKIREMYDNQD